MADKSVQEGVKLRVPQESLERGVGLVKALSDDHGRRCSFAQLATSLEVSPKSSSLRLRVAAARMFGLLGNDRGMAVLTDLGQQVVDPEKSARALVNAFLNVESYRRIYSDYEGQLMPSPAALETALRDMGVGEKFAPIARRVFLRSAKYAGFVTNDRLIKPTIRSSENTEGDGASDDMPDVSAATTVPRVGVAANHPVLRGLLEVLPDGEFEGSEKKQQWFDLFRGAFEMVYGPLDPSAC